MAITVQCPNCQTATQIPETASKATCPKCLKTFSAEYAAWPPEAVPHQEKYVAEESTPSQGTWANPYGAAAFALATVALLSASLVGIRMLTIALAIFGLLVVALGLVAGQEDRKSKDWVWFALGSAVNGLVLYLALFLPGLLNGFWALNVAVPQADPDKQLVVPRDQPRAPGKPLTADDWVDARRDAIRHGNVVVRVKSVKSRATDGNSSLQINVEIINIGDDVVSIAGFGGDKNTPRLSDGSGRSYAFLEQQQGKRGEGGPVFTTSGAREVELLTYARQDYLWLFEAPPGGFDLLKLEVPASSWGRNGRCKFRIAVFFDENSLPANP